MLEPTGMRITQYALLAQIERSAPLTITDLAKIMVMDRNGLGHNLRLLERDNLLAMTAGADRRSREISLSTTGRRRLVDAKPFWKAAQKQLTASKLFDGLVQPLATIADNDLG
ncbi:MAG TPA: MarR family transcriptional regulator [Steroidobacteraceae bacterium]